MHMYIYDILLIHADYVNKKIKNKKLISYCFTFTHNILVSSYQLVNQNNVPLGGTQKYSGEKS